MLGEDQFMTLVIENHGPAAVWLEKGMRLGTATPVELVPAPKGQKGGSQERSGRVELVSRVDVDPMHPDARVDELFTQLKLDLKHLTPTEPEQLGSLLSSYSDVFAVDVSELGTTALVMHSIDTGDHRPVRQPVRRTPFTL
jgi:hypothetical protein